MFINGKEIINLTPHTVTILSRNTMQPIAVFPSEGNARCKQTTEIFGNIGEIELSRTTFGQVENLRPFEEGKFYIVSRIVMSALQCRPDLLVPNELVRDENGVIIGALSLAIN